MVTNDLALMQEYMLSVFSTFDEICKKHDIKYSMEGGTLLGAAKFKGFVPWDDDIDVIMRREDYERFLKVAPNELGEEFFLQSYNNVTDFPLNYAKLCMNKTKILNYAYSHLDKMNHGIFMDIFPIDNVSSKNFKLQRAFVGAFTSARAMKLKVVKLKGIRAFLYGALSLLPMKFLIGNIQFWCNINNKKKTEQRYEICNSNKRFKPLPYEMYEDYAMMPFGDKSFMAVKNYDFFLKTRFGENYMAEMPSEDKRGRSHIQEVYIDDEIINKR